jgi:hypothetical protein
MNAGSSGRLPEVNQQSKAEYTNTQQDLPAHGILSHVSRLMQAFRVLGKVFS